MPSKQTKPSKPSRVSRLPTSFCMIAAYVDYQSAAALQVLSAQTGVPQQVYLRTALWDWMAKHKRELHPHAAAIKRRASQLESMQKTRAKARLARG